MGLGLATATTEPASALGICRVVETRLRVVPAVLGKIGVGSGVLGLGPNIDLAWQDKKLDIGFGSQKRV